jgi:hypothetical protein
MGALLERVRAANAKLETLLGQAHEALAGRRNFAPEDLRALAAPVAELAPVVAQAPQLRRESPEMDTELAAYAQNLGRMQGTLDALRCVLLARCASVQTERAHLQTVTLWAQAWRRTQPGGPG